MEGNYAFLESKELKVKVRLPGEQLFSDRFTELGVVEQVTLNGKHCFCQPEQIRSDRRSSNGIGLCSEFVWDEPGLHTEPGNEFIKPGVGLLKQHPEGGAYDISRNYHVRPFKTTYKISDQKVTFYQHQESPDGVSADIIRCVEVNRNTATLHTMIRNTGDTVLDFSEYQHNFLSIDNLPVGPGYILEVPYDGTLSELPEKVKTLKNGSKITGILKVEDQSVLWNKDMAEGIYYHKVTSKKEILDCPSYTWKLSHENSDASVSETVHFVPEELVIWGIEHCVCAEVYGKWHIKPGERQMLSRTWRFEDELTGN